MPIEVSTRRPRARQRPRRTPAAQRRIWRPGRIAAGLAVAVSLCYVLLLLALVLLRWVPPPTTAVQVERRWNASAEGRSYTKRYRFIPLSAISPHLVHAVLAAEDARFFQHGGFDWKEVDNAIHEDLENGRRRGASTIDQQLVRNLFLSTAPSVLRKALEFSIVPLAEIALPKRRILELYLNVVEWGPGVYGAEAAGQFYYHEPARRLSRQQALELSSILPAPLHRRPGRAEWYVQRIDERMRQAGW